MDKITRVDGCLGIYMKKIASIGTMSVLLISCSPGSQKLSSVKQGMSKTEVTAIIGEPKKKNVLNKTEIWDYPDSAKTIVFRMDTVYTIITSAKARIDSMGIWLDSTDNKVEKGFGEIGSAVKDAANKVKNKLAKDTAAKKP